MNNKRWTRILANAMTMSLMIALLASCASDAENSETQIKNEDTTTQAETEPVLSDNLPEMDMGGYEFTIFIPSQSALSWALRAIDVEETTGDIVYDEIYARNRRAEERFNCVIREEQQSSNATTNFVNAVLAGDNTYKIGQINDESINSVNTAGVLTTWDNLPYVNLDADWWNKSANEMFVINGQQYAAIGDFNLSEYSKSYMIYFNKDIYAEITQEKSPYEMVMDGTWTLEALATLSKQYARDLNGDATMTNVDRFGYAGCAKVGMNLLITGSGVTFVDNDESGNPRFAIPYNEGSFNKMQTIIETFANSTDWYYNAPEPMGGVQDELFIDGRVLFQASTIWNTESYRSLEFDIGMLPSPKYDESQEQYYSLTVGGLVTAIPKTLDDTDLTNVSIILEALSFDSRQNVLPVYKETVLQTKYARDEESSKVIDIIFDSQTFDTGVIVWTAARVAYVNGPFFKFNDTLASTTETVKVKMEDAIKKTIDALSK